MVCDYGIFWSFSLVSLDEAHILIINLPVFLWLFVLMSYVGLWSMVVLTCFSRRGSHLVINLPVFLYLFLLLLQVGL